MGEDIRTAARAHLGGRRTADVPAHVDPWRAWRRVPSDRWLHRPEPADVCPCRGRAAPRGRDLRGHPGHRNRGGGWSRPSRGDRSRRYRDRARGERGRDVRAGDRPHGGRQRAPDSVRPRIPHYATVWPPSRYADDDRSVAARLLPPGIRRPDHGRLRAKTEALGPGRHPERLQRPPARARLGPLRAADDQRDRADSSSQGRGGRAPGQRPGGVHARQRVHPRAERGARILDRRRLLRARPGRRRRNGPPGGGVDR